MFDVGNKSIKNKCRKCCQKLNLGDSPIKKLSISPGMDKIKFGHKFFSLPYLPIQLVWTFWNKSLLLEKVSKTSRGGGVLVLRGEQSLISVLRVLSSFLEFLGGILGF